MFKQITKNYNLELKLSKFDSNDIFSFDIRLTKKKVDHAGFFLCLILINFIFEFNIYNKNHKDDDDD